MNPTRRDVLKAGAGAAAAGSLAGCLDILGVETGSDADGYTMFFPLQALAEGVAGDEMTFDNPVGTGRMGHGWSPPANLVPDIVDTEAFIYLDSPEFPWAQDVAETLERDHPDDVRVIDLLTGVQSMLIEPGESHDHDGHEEEDGHHEEDGHDHQEEDDHDGHEKEDSHHEEDGHDDHQKEDDHDGHEEKEGDHDGHEEEDGDHGGHEEEGGDHDHDAFYDPHCWLDPLIAREMVDRLAEEFADIDSDSDGVYEENAADYRERITGVHGEFLEVVNDAELDVAVLAGHDSFGYLEHRYGFELATPTGVSANAEVSQRDLQGLIETIEDNGIDTILYDAFEAPAEEYPQMVDTLLENTDATDAMPVSPVSGTTESWNDRGWGWVEQMTELNLPALEAALNPSR